MACNKRTFFAIVANSLCNSIFDIVVFWKEFPPQLASVLVARVRKEQELAGLGSMQAHALCPALAESGKQLHHKLYSGSPENRDCFISAALHAGFSLHHGFGNQDLLPPQDLRDSWTKKAVAKTRRVSFDNCNMVLSFAFCRLTIEYDA